MTAKTLIYPGSGWDSEFLPFFRKRGYGRFLLYDSLPGVPHYTPLQAGFRQSRDPETFFRTLHTEFGEGRHDRAAKTIFFCDETLEYRYDRDVNTLSFLPAGDVLFRGFFPASWGAKGWLQANRIFYVSCDTSLDPVFALEELGLAHKDVHLHRPHEYCTWDEDSQSSDEEA